MIPPAIIEFLVKLAITFGIPMIVKYIPGLPKEVLDIVEALINALKEAPKAQRKTLKRDAKECVGVACKINLKGEK